MAKTAKPARDRYVRPDDELRQREAPVCDLS
jgi:hypothetical protein